MCVCVCVVIASKTAIPHIVRAGNSLLSSPADGRDMDTAFIALHQHSDHMSS